MESITLDVTNMQQVTSYVSFFQNPPAMLGVATVLAIVFLIISLSTKGKKYNWVARAFFWLFVVIAALMLIWLIGFGLYH